MAAEGTLRGERGGGGNAVGRKEGRKEGHRKTDGKGPRTPVKEEERRAAHATKLDQHKKERGFFGLAVDGTKWMRG